MKKYFPLALVAVLLTACRFSPPASTSSGQPAPTIDRFTFDEIDIAGCGMSLYPADSNPNQDGIYLFSGLVDSASPAQTSSPMRMKINGEIVRFDRTLTSGKALPGGQFAAQTFVSEDGRLTVSVVAAEAEAGADPEDNRIPAATIRLIQNSVETSVTAVGSTGC